MPRRGSPKPCGLLPVRERDQVRFPTPQRKTSQPDSSNLQCFYRSTPRFVFWQSRYLPVHSWKVLLFKIKTFRGFEAGAMPGLDYNLKHDFYSTSTALSTERCKERLDDQFGFTCPSGELRSLVHKYASQIQASSGTGLMCSLRRENYCA